MLGRCIWHPSDGRQRCTCCRDLQSTTGVYISRLPAASCLLCWRHASVRELTSVPTSVQALVQHRLHRPLLAD
jgi:hypothetical protein